MWILILSHTKVIELASCLSLVGSRRPKTHGWESETLLLRGKEAPWLGHICTGTICALCGGDGMSAHSVGYITWENCWAWNTLSFITKQHVNCSLLWKETLLPLKVLCKLQEMVWVESSQGRIFYLCEPSRGNSPHNKIQRINKYFYSAFTLW